MATIKDVSRKSGFSVTTVSRALNDHDDVNEETKKKIREVALELDYVPNINAKSLVQKKSSTIGFIVEDLSTLSILDNFALRIFMGSSDCANDNMYEVILIQINSKLQQNKSFSHIIRERNLDGAILQGFSKESDFCQDAFNSDVPVVFIDIPLENKTSTYVGSDINQSLNTAFDYLREKGHSEIGFVHGYSRAHITDLWKKAYNNYVIDNNVNHPDSYTLDGEYSSSVSLRKGIKYLEDNPNITAVFCTSDIMAIGLIQAAHHLNKRVPEDISVLGFDNIILSQYFSPAITTISQDPYLFGKYAFESLLLIINGNDNFIPVIVETSIQERESVSKL